MQEINIEADIEQTCKKLSVLTISGNYMKVSALGEILTFLSKIHATEGKREFCQQVLDGSQNKSVPEFTVAALCSRSTKESSREFAMV